MPASWEIKSGNSVLVGILHVDVTSIAWALGLRSLQIPGQISVVAGLPFDHARNALAMQAIDRGADYLFFLDSDVIPPGDAIVRLMSHNLPIVSGVYHRRSPPIGIPVMQKPAGQWITKYPQNQLIEVDVVGAGCLLIHRSVLERLPPQRHGKHWFAWGVDLKDSAAVTRPWEIMSEDFTFCFKGDAWIAGPQMKRIKQIREGDLVVDHLGDLRRVLGAIRRHYAGDMLKVRSFYMAGVETTPQHKFYIHNDRGTGIVRQLQNQDVDAKECSWVEAKDIRVGDLLVVPKPQMPPTSLAPLTLDVREVIDCRGTKTFPDGKIGYNRTRKTALRIAPSIPISPEFCRLLGYYIAEGFPHAKYGAVNFAFGEQFQEDVEDCRYLLKKVFGADSSVSTGAGSSRVTSSSKLLGLLFSELCGHGAYKKKLPYFWSSLDRECLRNLIRGYWAGDGSYNDSNFFGMSTMSKRLSREVQAALLRLGVLCGLSFRDNQYGTVSLMSIPHAMTSRFGKLVEFDCAEKNPDGHQYYIETPTHFLVEVREIETVPHDGWVYNLKVEETESYTANGVGVHNCMWAKDHGYKVMVDTGVQCRHVGFSQAIYGGFQALESHPVG